MILVLPTLLRIFGLLRYIGKTALAFRRAKVQLFPEPNRAKSNLFKPSAILWYILGLFGTKIHDQFAHIRKI